MIPVLMGPSKSGSPHEGDTPREAADRLYALCEELEHHQVPTHQVEELRDLSGRFLHHMAGQFAFWERLEKYARRQKSCL